MRGLQGDEEPHSDRHSAPFRPADLCLQFSAKEVGVALHPGRQPGAVGRGRLRSPADRMRVLLSMAVRMKQASVRSTRHGAHSASLRHTLVWARMTSSSHAVPLVAEPEMACWHKSGRAHLPRGECRGQVSQWVGFELGWGLCPRSCQCPLSLQSL